MADTLTEADKDVVLRLECVRLACDHVHVNNADPVLVAQRLYDFCKGNKPAYENVPPA